MLRARDPQIFVHDRIEIESAVVGSPIWHAQRPGRMVNGSPAKSLAALAEFRVVLRTRRLPPDLELRENLRGDGVHQVEDLGEAVVPPGKRREARPGQVAQQLRPDL